MGSSGDTLVLGSWITLRISLKFVSILLQDLALMLSTFLLQVY